MTSVVVPVYGNATTLIELQSRLWAVLTRLNVPFEIIYVNDASPGQSGEVLAQLAAQSSNVKVVSLARNIGQNAAIRVGLSHAHAQAQQFVIMDADLQDEPEYLPSLLEKLTGPYAVVFAARSGSYHANAFNALTSKVFKGLFGALAGNTLPEGTGLFLALNRDLRDRIVYKADGWPYLIGFIARSGVRATSIPVRRQLRASGKSTYTFWKRAKLALRAIVYTYSPLAGHAKEPEIVFAQKESSLAKRLLG